MKKLAGVGKINDAKRIKQLEPGEVLVSQIDFSSSENIRFDYNKKSIQELAGSIKKNGQLEPVGISREQDPETNKYRLLYGFRRFMAISEVLKYETIKTVKVDEHDREVIQLIENVQREDLSDYEIAKTLLALKSRTKETNKELAERLSKSEQWVKLKITHAEVVKPLEGLTSNLDKITTSHINETIGLDSESQSAVIQELSETTAQKGKAPTIKETRERVRKKKKSPKNKTKQKNLSLEEQKRIWKNELEELKQELSRLETQYKKEISALKSKIKHKNNQILGLKQHSLFKEPRKKK